MDTTTVEVPTVLEQVKALNEDLKRAQEAYYQRAQPLMSDAEYDQMEAQLRGLVEAHPELAVHASVLTSVGSDLGSPKGRVRHERPMLSIENKYEKSHLLDFFHAFPAGTSMVLEPKRDGSSAELRYRGGELTLALTRGNGVEGEDITAQVMQVQAIPKRIYLAGGLSASLNIRGELVMRHAELARLQALARESGGRQYTSSRNLTAGTMKLKDVSEVAKREILFIPWEMYGAGSLPDSSLARLLMLQAVGFPAYEGVLVGDEAAILQALDTLLQKNSQSDIAADGVVIKVNSHRLREGLGVGNKYTNWMCCYKPQSAKGESYLREVIWQTGRSGKVTPVGIIDPISLAGATITRVTLNNLTWIQNMGLRINSRVLVVRSGDVIPEIVAVLD